MTFENADPFAMLKHVICCCCSIKGSEYLPVPEPKKLFLPAPFYLASKKICVSCFEENEETGRREKVRVLPLAEERSDVQRRYGHLCLFARRFAPRTLSASRIGGAVHSLPLPQLPVCQRHQPAAPGRRGRLPQSDEDVGPRPSL